MGMMLVPSVPSLVVDLSAAVLTSTYLNFGHGPRLRLLRRDRVPVRGRVVRPQGALPAPAGLGVAAGHLRRHPRRLIDAGVRRCSERDLAVLRSFARRIDPSDAGAHNNLGVLYYQKGLIPEAVAEFSRALELDPRMQVAQAQPRDRLPGQRLLRPARRRAAGAAPPRRRATARPAGSWPGPTPRSASTDEAVAEFDALLAWHPDDIPALLQLGLAEKARGRVEVAERVVSPRGRARPGQPGRAASTTARRSTTAGLNEAALETLAPGGRTATPTTPTRTTSSPSCSATWACTTRRAPPPSAPSRSTRRSRGRRPTCRSTDRGRRHRRRARQSLADSMRRALADGGTLAHFNLGLAFRQKGYYAGGAARVPPRARPGEDRRLTLQAMAEVHLLRRDLDSALELYDALVRGARRLAQAVERARRLPAPGGPARRGAGILRARDRARRATTRSPGTTSACCWRTTPGTGEAEAAFRAALQRQRQLARAAAQPRAAALPAAPLPAGARGLPRRCSRRPSRQRGRLERGRPRAHGAARATPTRGTPSRARWTPTPRYAAAHYNLSFTLSQLGDFDGALRATKRALELEPYYVPQKFQLTIDLQYEDPLIAIVPEISADVTARADLGDAFAFDAGVLDGHLRRARAGGGRGAPRPRAAEEAALGARPRLHQRRGCSSWPPPS